VDVSSEAIHHAQQKYHARNLVYRLVERAEDAPLPFPDRSFEVVISLQVIEHVSNVALYLKDISRVLAPGGYAILATPDRSSRLLSFQKPWNMWHLREYSKDQLQNTLSAYFSDVRVLNLGGQKETLQVELDRTRRLRWLTLPVTLPFTPELVRVNGLRILRWLRFMLRPATPAGDAKSADDAQFRISENEEYSVNLVAVARRGHS